VDEAVRQHPAAVRPAPDRAGRVLCDGAGARERAVVVAAAAAVPAPGQHAGVGRVLRRDGIAVQAVAGHGVHDPLLRRAAAAQPAHHRRAVAAHQQPRPDAAAEHGAGRALLLRQRAGAGGRAAPVPRQRAARPYHPRPGRPGVSPGRAARGRTPHHPAAPRQHRHGVGRRTAGGAHGPAAEAHHRLLHPGAAQELPAAVPRLRDRAADHGDADATADRRQPRLAVGRGAGGAEAAGAGGRLPRQRRAAAGAARAVFDGAPGRGAEPGRGLRLFRRRGHGVRDAAGRERHPGPPLDLWRRGRVLRSL